MQLDIFADVLDESALSADLPPAVLPDARSEVARPRAVARDADWCMKVLEQGLASSKRQLAALCGSPERLSVVLDAVWTIARAKRSAYERASRGERLSALGCANGPLGDAGAVLSAVFLSNDAIPMSAANPDAPVDVVRERER